MPHGYTAHYFPERAEVRRPEPPVRPVDIGKARTLLLRRERVLSALKEVDKDIAKIAEPFGGINQYEMLTGVFFSSEVEIQAPQQLEGRSA